MSESPELASVAELAAAKLGLRGVTFVGKGAFKETYRVEDMNGRPLALKLVDRRKIGLDRTEREISALKRCNSDRIAKVMDSQIFKAPDERVFDLVVEEFLDGGSLDDRLKTRPFNRSEVIGLAVGLAQAVRDMYPLQIVHRDIKPANIMFRQSSPEPVLVDFGLVRDLSQTSLTATWQAVGPGTPFYASPEQLNNDKPLIDWRSDQFSIGVVLGHLLTSRHPYQTDPTNSSTGIYAARDRRGPSAEFRVAMRELGLPVVVKMVNPWPVQRFPTPDALLEILKS